MSDLLKHKGFSARVEFSAGDEMFTGRVIGIDDNIVFSGTSVRELKKAMRDAVDAYIEKCRRKGRSAGKTYSGKLLFRFPSELHAGIAAAAANNGQSINEWGRVVLEAALKASNLRGAKGKSISPRGRK